MGDVEVTSEDDWLFKAHLELLFEELLEVFVPLIDTIRQPL